MNNAGSDNVVLIGMRASGKTTLGRQLARRLGLPFLDLDEEVGRRAGCDADEMLAREGEAAFRRWEAEALVQAAGLRGHVIATGGGAVLHPKAFARLAATGTVIYLDVPVDELVARSSRRPRPPLTDRGPEEEVRHLHGLRHPLYVAAAQFTIPAENVDPILDLLNSRSPPGCPRDTPCPP